MSFTSLWFVICFNLFVALVDAITQTHQHDLKSEKNNEEAGQVHDEVIWGRPLSEPAIALQVKEASLAHQPVWVSFRHVFHTSTGPKKNDGAFKRKKRRQRGSIFPELDLFERNTEEEKKLLDVPPTAAEVSAEPTHRQTFEDAFKNPSLSETIQKKVTIGEMTSTPIQTVDDGYNGDDEGGHSGSSKKYNYEHLFKRRKLSMPISLEKLANRPERSANLLREPRKKWNRRLFFNIFRP